MNIEFSFKKRPKAEEAIKIYTRLGWGKLEEYNSIRFEKAFENSFFLTAYDSSNLIGFIRFLSDGAHDTSILEFVVHPKYQGFNIGKKMLNDLVQKLGHTNIYLNCPENTVEFFLKNEFKKHQLKGLSRTAVVK